MKKYKAPVRFTGQHFTVDTVLVADAIDRAAIDKDDTVLDIGAGKGSLTGPLASRCRTVIAIERDRQLIGVLKRQFARDSHVAIVTADFRSYTLPHTHFKVVSSIPYGITSHVLEKLMFDGLGQFAGGTLIMQLEPAQKLCAERSCNPQTVFYRSFFDLSLAYAISPGSFMPPPKVQSALVRIRQVASPVPTDLKEDYLQFLRYMLRDPGLSAGTALKGLFRKSQVREIVARYGIAGDPAGRLTARQWAACFLEMRDKVPRRFHPGREK